MINGRSANRWPRDDYRDAMWECPNLDPLERAVANAYAEYAKNGIEAWVVTAEMTRRTGIESRSTITKVTGRLVAKGWLVRVKKGTPHRAAVYRIAIPDDCMDDVHKTSLCPSEAHKGPVDNSNGLVSTRGAQAEDPLVSISGAKLVSISGAKLVSTRGAQSVQDQITNQSSGRAAPAVHWICNYYGVSEEDGLAIWQKIEANSSETIRSTLSYAKRCIEAEPERWRPAAPGGGRRDCDACFGSGLAEDDNGDPTGPCPACAGGGA